MELSRMPLIAAAAALLLAFAGSLPGEQARRASGPASDPSAGSGLDVQGPASPDQLVRIRAVAQEQFERKDYAAAIAWAQRYVKAGGVEADVRPLLVQSYLRKGDYANAARELQWEIQSAERAARVPAQERLLLLQDCYARLSDANASAWVLEKLVAYYPTKEYWADLLDRTEKRPDFGAPLALDVNRLRFLTGVLATAQAWLDYADQAQRAGFPAEAKSALQAAMARGILGSGPDAARHRQLLLQYTVQAQAQQRQLADHDVEQAARRARDGIELLDLGYAHVTLGDHAKGIALMEEGLRKGGGLASRPQIAKLHFGEALLRAGERERAIDVLQAVGGRHGANDMGRIWALHAQNLR